MVLNHYIFLNRQQYIRILFTHCINAVHISAPFRKSNQAYFYRFIAHEDQGGMIHFLGGIEKVLRQGRIR